MSDKLKNVLIGSFFIVIAALVIWMIFFIKPTIGNGKQILFVRFSDVTMIRKGTRVTLEGFPVGEVVTLYPIADARTHPVVDALGNLYFYQATLKVDSSVKMYQTDEIAVETYGLLGEKSIAILPKPIPLGEKPKLVTEKTPIYARSLSQLDLVFHEMTRLAKIVQNTFSLVNTWFEDHEDLVTNVLASLESTMQEMSQALHALNASGLVQDAKTTIENINEVMTSIRDGLEELQRSHAFANMGAILEDAKNAFAHIASITKTISSGEGTLGKLIENNDLYMELQSAMHKFHMLMQDINQYGLFFYQNKTWMRLRAQRAIEMEHLENPENFQQYCEEQVHKIQGSMQKLAELIEKVKGIQQNEVLENQTFRKDFSEFLDHVDHLSSKLKMYNDELVRLKQKRCP